MSTTIGSLIAELGLDDSKFKTQFATIKKQALNDVRDIEKSFKNAFSLKELTITAKVDDKQLTDLNKHLSLKEKHFKQVQQEFNRSPLTPKVDLNNLDKLETRLNNLHRVASKPLNLRVNEPAMSSRDRYSSVPIVDSGGISQSRGSSLPDNANLVASNDRLITAIESLSSSVGESDRTNKELPVKISKSIYVSSRESLTDKIFNLPARVMESVITGSLEGVGQQLAFDFTTGAQKYVETKTGKSASTMGRDFGRFAYGRGKQVAMVGADALGYRGGLAEVADDIRSFGESVDKFLDPKLWLKKSKEIEDLIVAVGEDLTVYNNPQRAQERVSNFAKVETEGLRTGS